METIAAAAAAAAAAAVTLRAVLGPAGPAGPAYIGCLEALLTYGRLWTLGWLNGL